MHLVKPHWLSHPGEIKDFEVYSCHVSPDGSRLATAAGDGHVRIWSTEAIYNSANPDYDKPKQLAAVSHHSGTIHAVRFSGNGKYLASGADDKVVCVYVLDPNPPPHVSTFGSNEPPPVENWRVLRRLIGHDNDVQDLGWSYDSSILVSVGLDSKVVVWSGHTFEKLKTISNHQSHVKGVTFDPANKYFATASDDRTIKVFRFTSPPANATAQDQTNNFVLEHTIVDPFLTSPLTTYFRRCSWSPDGVHIAAANSVNGPVSSVAIIVRGTWTNDINLIGHEGPVEVCAFSPRLFYREPITESSFDANGNNTNQSVSIIACAGQDKTLSIWNTSYARPFAITHELAGKSISDLAWTPSGETLFVTSLDGSIMAAVFEPGELGYVAPVDENEKSLSKFGAGRRAGILEGTDGLLLEENSKAGELRGVQGRMGELMGDAGNQPTANGATNEAKANGTTGNGSSTETPAAQPSVVDKRVDKLKQRVTVTKDGKKRIQPLLVSSSSGIAESTLPQTQLVSAATQGTRNDQPYNILDLSKPYDGYPKGGVASLILGTKRKFADIEGDEERQVEKRITAASRNGSAPIVMDSAEGLVPPGPSKKEPGPTAPPGPLRPAIVSSSLMASHLRLAVPQVRSIIVRTQDSSAPPSADPSDAAAHNQNEDAILLEARNSSGASRTGRPQDRDPTRINCTRRGQTLWQDFIPKPVLLLTGNLNFWAAACEDGSVHTWTPAGRRLLNALVMDAQPVIMEVRGWHLLAVTAVGTAYVWNIKTQSSPHPPISLAPILDVAVHSQAPHLSPGPGVIFARLNSEGRIIVGLSNGDGYMYSPSLYTWQRITEPWWAVGSQYWNTADPATSMATVTTNAVSNSSAAEQAKRADERDEVDAANLSAGIIPLLERNTTNHVLLRGRAYFLQRLIKQLLSAEGFEGFESAVSVAHLENRLAAAKALGSREEFKMYLLMYAKRLGAEGMKAKIEELLRTLAGDLLLGEEADGDDMDDEESDDGTARGEGATRKSDERKVQAKRDDTICGWDKEELLRDVVLVLGKHRDLQRITVPYARLLGLVSERADNADNGMAVDIS